MCSCRISLRKCAFTLVELLVVIGIIAVLVGLLLPAITRSRRHANAVKCLASLREIGKAFSMYAMDYRGVWPVSVHQMPPANSDYTKHIYWSDLLAPYLTSEKPAPMNFEIPDSQL